MTPFPLYMHGDFGYPTAMALATVIGLSFGFVLERAGFGRASILVSQFFGTDNRVLKVMFSGIATATVGLGVLAGVGMVDLTMLTIPTTYIGPHLVGGLLLGSGFAISGYCPGTALVAAGSGHRDGWYSLLGTMIGAIAFALAWPTLESFYASGDLGAITLPDLLGLSWPTVAAGVVVMAIGTFLGAEKLERFLHGRAGTQVPEHHHPTRNLALGGVATLAALGIGTLLLPATVDAQVLKVPDHLAPLALGERVVSDPTGMWLVDLRSPEDCAKARIAGAICLTAEDPVADLIGDLPPTRTLVLYAAGDTGRLPVSVQAYNGPVAVLDGGYTAFEAQVLDSPTAADSLNREEAERFAHLVAMNGQLTGSTAAAPPVVVRAVAVKRAAKKGGGC